MIYKISIGLVALAAAMAVAMAGAAAFDEAKYPDWRGQWSRLRTLRDQVSPNPSFDPNKFQGLAQEAPLTPEYKAILEASLADQAAGGAGLDRDYVCFPAGMPRMMNVYSTMEIIVRPEVTHILMGFLNENRRIFTDDRSFNEVRELSVAGYSIGRWIDSDGSGRYDVLEVETRAFKGMRTLDSTAIPLHQDNQTIIKERFFSDKTDRNVLHDEITIIDHAFTRPWTVMKDYRRAGEAHPIWRDAACIEENQHVRIGNDSYMLSADGLLMPAKKDQPPPDLRYFKRP
ncbi:MAG TPA: hypothetical protein VIY51_02700 [Xanthobacteraceae bacterium]